MVPPSAAWQISGALARSTNGPAGELDSAAPMHCLSDVRSCAV